MYLTKILLIRVAGICYLRVTLKIFSVCYKINELIAFLCVTTGMMNRIIIIINIKKCRLGQNIVG